VERKRGETRAERASFSFLALDRADEGERKRGKKGVGLSLLLGFFLSPREVSPPSSGSPAEKGKGVCVSPYSYCPLHEHASKRGERGGRKGGKRKRGEKGSFLSCLS